MYLSPERLAVFNETIKRNGLKYTPQRTAIYAAIAELKTHPSADEIYRIVRKEYPAISFDTVNRTLLTFVEIGLINLTESVSGIRRFEPGLETHHHLHCMKCGAITDFSYPDFDNLPAPDKIGRGFKVLGRRVSMFGICGACAKKEKLEEKAAGIKK